MRHDDWAIVTPRGFKAAIVAVTALALMLTGCSTASEPVPSQVVDDSATRDLTNAEVREDPWLWIYEDTSVPVAVVTPTATKPRTQSPSRSYTRSPLARPTIKQLLVETAPKGTKAWEIKAGVCIVKRESNGRIRAQNKTSTASGLFQFIRGTWNNFKGYYLAKQAPATVQAKKFWKTWAHGKGRNNWWYPPKQCW